MPSSSITSVSVSAQISSSRYQSLHERARRETSRLSTAPTCPRPTSATSRLPAVTANGRRARVSLILVHDVVTSCRPSQILGSLHQIILSQGAPDIFTHLKQGRLPEVDDGKTVKMVRTDFGRWLSSKHETPPFWFPHQ